MISLRFVVSILSSSFYLVSATCDCTECISLSDLISPALGIQFTTFTLSTAVAFHNGTLRHESTVQGSVEYQNLMLQFRKESAGGQVLSPQQICFPPPPEHLKGYIAPPSRSQRLSRFLYGHHLLPRWLYIWCLPDAEPYRPAELVDTNPQATRIFAENLSRLLSQSRPTSSTHDETDVSSITHAKPRFTIPSWLTDSQVCPILMALEQVGRPTRSFDHSPSVAFAALGWDLCRIESEWMPCTPPGRIMTLEYSKSDRLQCEELTATFSPRTNHYMPNWLPPMSYSLFEPSVTCRAVGGSVDGDRNVESNTQSAESRTVDTVSEIDEEARMVRWINDFAMKHHPERVIISLHDPSPRRVRMLRSAVLKSEISHMINTFGSLRGGNGGFSINAEDLNAVPVTKNAVVLGIAKLAKVSLESQGTDCIEFGDCEAIRREADRIAGKPDSSGGEDKEPNSGEGERSEL